MSIEKIAALQQFVQKNYQQDPSKLAFKKILVEGYDNRFVLNQLYGKQKAKNKLPFLFDNPQILYPAKVSVEQSSSQKTAAWKANLVHGTSLLDMTGGFGVDTYHFSKKIKQVTYLEKNTELYEITTHNFGVLGAENISTYNEDSLSYLNNCPQRFDWIYLDPARRDEVGNRKVGLSGYFPNVLVIKDLLLAKANCILLKLSPMLDIQQAIRQLEVVEKVIVLAVQNEVKELLLILQEGKNNLNSTPSFECIDLRKNGQIISYIPSSNLYLEEITYDFPKSYIYEPNAAILKAGLFNEIALDFELRKLHPNTHLYTSDTFVPHFPGRVFSCRTTTNYNKKAVKPYLAEKQANITTRNFPDSVKQIKKKLGLKDGGDSYLFACTLPDERLAILVCEKSV